MVCKKQILYHHCFLMLL